MNNCRTGEPFLPTDNLLLAALPGASYRKLQPHLKPFPLPLGRVLSEPGDRLTHVFFPTSGIVSLLNTLENGASASVALVGNEGLVGMSVFPRGREREDRCDARSCTAPVILIGCGQISC